MLSRTRLKVMKEYEMVAIEIGRIFFLQFFAYIYSKYRDFFLIFPHYTSRKIYHISSKYVCIPI